MHQKDGAIINPAADGIAWIQLDVTWEGEEYPRRHGIVGDGLPYENNFHTTAPRGSSFSSILASRQAG